MRLPRLKVRTLMLLVALIALLVWATVESRQLHGLSWHYYLKSLDAATNEYQANQIQLFPSYKNRRDHYASLKRKYQHAASHPWESVSPDPPEPEKGGFDVSRYFENCESSFVSEDGLEWEPVPRSLGRQWLDDVVRDLLPLGLGEWTGSRM